MAQSPRPDPDRLLDWLEGKLTAEEAAEIARTVAADPELVERAGWLQGFLDLSRVTTLADPPAAVRQAATAAFEAYVQSRRPPGLVQSFIAVLTADTWQRPAPAGVRRASLRSEPRQLIYSSDLADIALNAHMQLDGQQVNLEGQVFPLNEDAPADFLVQLLQEGVERQLALADELGKFSFADLPPGRYELLLSQAEVAIEVGPLELA